MTGERDGEIMPSIMATSLRWRTPSARTNLSILCYCHKVRQPQGISCHQLCGKLSYTVVTFKSDIYWKVLPPRKHIWTKKYKFINLAGRQSARLGLFKVFWNPKNKSIKAK